MNLYENWPTAVAGYPLNPIYSGKHALQSLKDPLLIVWRYWDSESVCWRATQVSPCLDLSFVIGTYKYIGPEAHRHYSNTLERIEELMQDALQGVIKTELSIQIEHQVALLWNQRLLEFIQNNPPQDFLNTILDRWLTSPHTRPGYPPGTNADVMMARLEHWLREQVSPNNGERADAILRQIIRHSTVISEAKT